MCATNRAGYNTSGKLLESFLSGGKEGCVLPTVRAIIPAVNS